VQRLFTIFPPGFPGLALLLLRCSVAWGVLQEDYLHRQALPWWVQASAVLISAALLVGYLTPIAALTALTWHGLVLLQLSGGDVRVGTFLVLDAVALALLGPGAYSLDSRLFGRRVVLLPPDP
jgi:uncharacterized membrane protein YphA (DoxX/SURF4 family)